MVTVVAEGQRDALLWTDVTLSTSYNECHVWTSGWTSPMNKCRATGRRKYAFPDPSVIVFIFHIPISTITSHNIGYSCFQPLWTSVHNSECMHFRTKNNYFFLVFIGTETSKNILHFLNTLYIYIWHNLPKGRSFTAHSGTKAAVLLKGRSSTSKLRNPGCSFTRDG